MLLRASAAEMNRSNAPFSVLPCVKREGLDPSAFLARAPREEEWVELGGGATLSSGLESVMVLSLPESSSPDPLSKFEALSLTSLSPSPSSTGVSPSSAGASSSSTCSCSASGFSFATLFLAAGTMMGTDLRLSAFLCAFSAV